MQRLSRLLLKAAGWTTEGGIPADEPRFVLIAAPHTSNWDGLIMLLAAQVFQFEMKFLIKKSWFVFPVGAALRRLGGVPVDRSRAGGIVERAVEEFATNERFVLAVPPEGTRARAPHWKLGFYHIARGAGVPLVLGYLDYERKVAGIGPVFRPTGNIDADFAALREFYEKIPPCYPESFGPIQPPPAKKAESRST